MCGGAAVGSDEIGADADIAGGAGRPHSRPYERVTVAKCHLNWMVFVDRQVINRMEGRICNSFVPVLEHDSAGCRLTYQSWCCFWRSV